LAAISMLRVESRKHDLFASGEGISITEKSPMKKAAIPVVLILALLIVAPLAARGASSLPPPPSSKPPVRPDAAEERKAWELFARARKENRRLEWDQCLSRKAFLKAKHLVINNYFDHIDPVTGRNTAWELVERCYHPACVGENLIRGMGEPEDIHRSLMRSPTHRENIVNPSYSRIGIGCYDYICVQIFTGF